MEIQGHIYKIAETETFPSGFSKRLLVVEMEGEYPQKIPMEFVKDKTSILDNYKVGDKVKVSINLRGNEYQDKFYLSAQGWRIENIEGAEKPEEKRTTTKEVFAEEDDDLQF